MVSPQEIEIEDLLKPLLLKDLRIQCRGRGINPGGGRETLIERLKDHMMSSGNRTLFSEGAIFSGAGLETAASKQDDDVSQTDTTSQLSSGDQAEALKNNYYRPEGQNVGNFITDRPSSRVLAPPGGGTSISIG